MGLEPDRQRIMTSNLGCDVLFSVSVLLKGGRHFSCTGPVPYTVAGYPACRGTVQLQAKPEGQVE